MDLQATLAGSFTFTILGGPPRYEEQPAAHLVACSDMLGSVLHINVTDILSWQRPPKRSDAFRVPIRLNFASRSAANVLLLPGDGRALASGADYAAPGRAGSNKELDGISGRLATQPEGSGFVFFIVIAVTEVAGLSLSLHLLLAHVIECAGVEHDPDGVVPAQTGAVGEDRAHLLLEVLGHLDRALLHRRR